jgi:hypothetical protein
MAWLKRPNETKMSGGERGRASQQEKERKT